MKHRLWTSHLNDRTVVEGHNRNGENRLTDGAIFEEDDESLTY